MIGSYLNAMLYSLELVEAYIYYFASRRSSKDPIFLKCWVATGLVSDTVGTIGVCALTFVNLVFADSITPGKLYWAMQMFTFSTTLSGFIFQSYMLHRLWILSRNYFCTFIALLIIVSFGIGINLIAMDRAVVNIGVVQEKVYQKWRTQVIVILVTNMLTDVSITTSLLWYLNRSRLYSHRNLRTKRLVTKISSLAIKTGVLPSVFALAFLVSYVSNKGLNIAASDLFAYMLGRVYISTMLYSLIYRDKLYSDGELINMDSTSLPSMTFSCDSSPPFQIPPLALPKSGPGDELQSLSNDKSFDLMSSNPTSPASYSGPHTYE